MAAGGPQGLWVSPAKVPAGGPGTLGLPAHGKAVRGSTWTALPAAWQVTAAGTAGEDGRPRARGEVPREPGHLRAACSQHSWAEAGEGPEGRARRQSGHQAAQTAKRVHEDSMASPRGDLDRVWGLSKWAEWSPYSPSLRRRVGKEQDKATPTIIWVPVVAGPRLQGWVGLERRHGSGEKVCVDLRTWPLAAIEGEAAPPRGRVPGVRGRGRPRSAGPVAAAA